MTELEQGIEDELRASLRSVAAPVFDEARLFVGVGRRRARRRLVRAGLAAGAVGVLAFVLLRPSAGRPVPMFAIGIANAAAEPVAPDERLLREAFARYRVGDDEGAQVRLQRIVDEHPSSRHLAEAAVGRGDAFFERGRMTEALAYYELAAARPSSIVYRYALYKAGWVHRNEGDRARAAAAWQRVLDGGDSRDPVVRQVQRDLEGLQP